MTRTRPRFKRELCDERKENKFTTDHGTGASPAEGNVDKHYFLTHSRRAALARHNGGLTFRPQAQALNPTNKHDDNKNKCLKIHVCVLVRIENGITKRQRAIE